MAPILCLCLMTPWRPRRRPGTGRRPRTCSSSSSSMDMLWRGKLDVLTTSVSERKVFPLSFFHFYSLFSPSSGEWRTWSKTFPPLRSVLPMVSSRSFLNGWTSPRSSLLILVLWFERQKLLFGLVLYCVPFISKCTFGLRAYLLFVSVFNRGCG